MGHYDGDPWSNHELNEVKCAECGNEFDQQEKVLSKLGTKFPLVPKPTPYGCP